MLQVATRAAATWRGTSVAASVVVIPVVRTSFLRAVSTVSINSKNFSRIPVVRTSFVRTVSTVSINSKNFSSRTSFPSSLFSHNHIHLSSCALPSTIRGRMSSSSALPPGERYDLVVFGATGFTGQFVVEEVARVAETEGGALRWAVAGRSRDKLQAVVEVARKETGLPLAGVALLEANVDDQSSVDAMTKQARVIINCVGPYVKWGEQVVKSCIDNGADHVDISGEPQFLEAMQLKHHAEAETRGVHVVGACGYDSIPAEIGINFLRKQFPGGLNSVEMYNRVHSGGAKSSIHTGTLESAMTALANTNAVKAQRKKLFPTKLPKQKFPQPAKSLIHHCPETGFYGIPFPSDVPVVYRSQRYRHDVQGLQPLQFQQFLAFRSWLQAAGMLLGMVYFGVMSMMGWTRSLVLKFPEVFTAGAFTKAGPTRESLKKVTFSTTMVGRGWSAPLAEPSDQHTTPPDAVKILKVQGSDPGYNGTSQMLVASAMTLLKEKQRCTNKGGVLTPGIAFSETGILQRLLDLGMKFDVKNL